VLLLHGLTDSSKGAFVTQSAKALVAQGVAVLALDAPHHGERTTPEDRQLFMKTFFAIGNAKTKGDLIAQIREVDKDRALEKLLTETVRQGVKDYRRAIDWLSTRKDVKADRIGAVGYSLGSIMSSILAGVDTRVRSIALCVGGDPTVAYTGDTDPATKQRGLETSSSLYIEHVAPRPVLMLNGKKDDIIPKAATDKLYAAAKDPKEIRWFDSGHTLPQDAVKDALTWTLNQLKGK
jgi:uncharacterized protein